MRKPASAAASTKAKRAMAAANEFATLGVGVNKGTQICVPAMTQDEASPDCSAPVLAGGLEHVPGVKLRRRP